MSRLISFVVLIAIIIIIGLLFYKVLIGFFIPVFLASVLVVVFRPLHRWVLVRIGQREGVAAALTTLLIMLVLLLPITAIGISAAVQGVRLIEQNDANTIALRINQLRGSLGLQMPPYEERLRAVAEQIDEIVENTQAASISDTDQQLARVGARTVNALALLQAEVQQQHGARYDNQFEQVVTLAAKVGQPSDEEFGPSKLAVQLKSSFTSLKSDLLGGPVMSLARETANPTRAQVHDMTESALAYVQPRLLTITGATGAFVAKLIFGSVILIVATFFFLYDGPAMIKSVMALSPLDDAYEQELLLEFDRISRAVVLATVLSAVAQGVTAGIGYYFVGMGDYLLLLVMLTTAFAMVPFVGPPIVWVPVCLYLAIDDRVTAAVSLAIWGVLAVGSIDNVVKAFVLHGQSQLHPLLALLSVLGGVQALGPIGIVVGPMVVAMLQTLLSILQREMTQLEKHNLVLSTESSSGPIPRYRARGPTPKEATTDDRPSSTSDEPQHPTAPQKPEPPPGLES